jgi:hypothetical protein
MLLNYDGQAENLRVSEVVSEIHANLRESAV